MRVMTLLGLLIGCDSGEKVTEPVQEINEDLDGDGFTEDVDCDDGDIQVNPEAMEICDGLDNNCDGNIDEEVEQEFYADSDEDGYGNADLTISACSAPDGFVDTGTDCNDSSAASYPGAEELCDGLDNDCDDDIDEDLDLDFYLDEDGDGFGNENEIVSGCAPELGVTTVAGDCDDQDPAISPVANELCNEIDDNCNGETDEGVQSTFYNDQDQDGFGDPATTSLACSTPEGYVDNQEDCNDIDSQIHPDADETCDEQDNDCDGTVDEEGAIGGLIWYADFDGDEYGDADTTAVFCTQPTNYVANSDDCDDSNSIFSPDATEVCNGYDDNCDGTIDEDGATGAPTWYYDGDADGYGNPEETVASCAQPSEYLADNTDCDDNDNDINPSAIEVCNGEDDNCDGQTDDATSSDAQTWYLDSDTDGYGDAANMEQACSQPSGHVLNSDDCDDSSDLVSPETIWYADADVDNYGSSLYTTTSCVQPSGYVADDTDCDDTESSAYPMATEVCDEIDNDCDGSIDEDVGDIPVWYLDDDGDGEGDIDVNLEACTQPTDYVSNSDDCDDAEPLAFSTGVEVCDGIDNNCDGQIDEGDVIGTEALCFADSCAEILAENPSAVDGVYYITDDSGAALEAYCEMDFEDGGWLAVFNYMHSSNALSAAADFHNRIIQNDDMSEAVHPDDTSSSIFTSNLDLSAYSEVVYGWASSDTSDVSQYGMQTASSNLVGTCYIDGYCGAYVDIGSFLIQPSGNTRALRTGSDPNYPHVGMGFSGQIITWGYDLNASSYGNWGNWYDLNACCNAGNTSDMTSSGWRYTVYIR
ncbi:MAG: hypothetical protein CL916_00540 [Deltaproteobacteria bacterium]|nr:hypothetical protein [Deltaproteobacteria bacterium]